MDSWYEGNEHNITNYGLSRNNTTQNLMAILRCPNNDGSFKLARILSREKRLISMNAKQYKYFVKYVDQSLEELKATDPPQVARFLNAIKERLARVIEDNNIVLRSHTNCWYSFMDHCRLQYLLAESNVDLIADILIRALPSV